MASEGEIVAPEGTESKNWLFKELYPKRIGDACSLSPKARAAMAIIKST